MRLLSRSLSRSVLSKCEPDLSKFLVKGGLLRGSVGKNIVLPGIGFTVVPDTTTMFTCGYRRPAY